jgi:hypothetical protein
MVMPSRTSSWAEELVERRQARLNSSNLTANSEAAAPIRHDQQTAWNQRKNQTRVAIEPGEEPFGIDAPKPQGEDVGELAQQLLALLLVAALAKLRSLGPWPR